MHPQQKTIVKNAPLLNIIKLDTHGVHLQKKTVKNAPLLNISKLDTHGVHLQKKTVKNAPLHTIIKLDTHGVHLWKKTVRDESFMKLSSYAHATYSPFRKSSNTNALLQYYRKVKIDVLLNINEEE